MREKEGHEIGGVAGKVRPNHQECKVPETKNTTSQPTTCIIKQIGTLLDPQRARERERETERERGERETERERQRERDRERERERHYMYYGVPKIYVQVRQKKKREHSQHRSPL